MWKLDKNRRIMWVAWAAQEGCFNVGYEFEPMYAGYVSDRDRLWAANCLVECGAWWLPQLLTHSLVIPNESLLAFSEECQTVLTSVEKLSAESGCAVEDVMQALHNMIRISSEARANGGWVEVHSSWPPHPGIPHVRL